MKTNQNPVPKVGLPNDDTQFRIEAHSVGLWSGQPEIRIRREYKGKPSRFGPSIPLSVISELIRELTNAQEKLTKAQEGGN